MSPCSRKETVPTRTRILLPEHIPEGAWDAYCRLVDEAQADFDEFEEMYLGWFENIEDFSGSEADHYMEAYGVPPIIAGFVDWTSFILELGDYNFVNGAPRKGGVYVFDTNV